MTTRILTTDAVRPDAAAVEEAARVLRGGGLVVIPTETVYGIAADAGNPAAVARLRAAKGRPETKPLPVMATSPEDVGRLARNPPPVAWQLARAFWPGPLTLVLPAGPAVSEAIHAGSHGVGLRSPDHAVALAVLNAAGRPLTLTSANLSGEPDTTTAADAMAALNGRVDLILDAGPTALGHPSTVLNLAVQPPVILREGGVSADRLREFLNL